MVIICFKIRDVASMKRKWLWNLAASGGPPLKRCGRSRNQKKLHHHPEGPYKVETRRQWWVVNRRVALFDTLFFLANEEWGNSKRSFKTVYFAILLSPRWLNMLSIMKNIWLNAKPTPPIKEILWRTLCIYTCIGVSCCSLLRTKENKYFLSK